MVRDKSGKLVPEGVAMYSGRSGTYASLNDALLKGELGLTPPSPFTTVFPGADHAEPKILWSIVDKPSLENTEILILINNGKGICEGPNPCWKVSQAILYTDQSLTVKWLSSDGLVTESETIRGTRIRLNKSQ